MAEWVSMPDMPEFESGNGYISLYMHFKSEDERERYVKDNQIEITRKMKGKWITHI